jgi:hypothetical protein
MEIEVDLNGLKVSNLAIIALAAVLVILGVVGYRVTPEGNRILTWEDWQVRKAHLEYRREVGVLQSALDRLAQVVNRTPDPLRAQMTADRVLRDLDEVRLAVLEPARGAVGEAALAVRAWALGGEREAAVQAVAHAVEVVQQAAEEVK